MQVEPDKVSPAVQALPSLQAVVMADTQLRDAPDEKGTVLLSLAKGSPLGCWRVIMLIHEYSVCSPGSAFSFSLSTASRASSFVLYLVSVA